MAAPGESHDVYPPGTELWVHRPLGYHHSALYIGNGEVVQVAGEPMDAVKALLHGKDHFTSTINRVSLAQFAHGDAVSVGPAGTAGNPSAAIHRALSKVGTPWDYNPLTHNCQHFSSWCVTGSEFSPEGSAILAIVQKVQKEEQKIVGGVEHAVHGIEAGIGGLFHHHQKQHA